MDLIDPPLLCCHLGSFMLLFLQVLNSWLRRYTVSVNKNHEKALEFDQPLRSLALALCASMIYEL